MRLAFRQLTRQMVRTIYTALPWLDGPRVRRIDIGYEKAGVVVRGEPIPWNADAVLIDIDVSFAVLRNWPKSDFCLDVAGEPPLLPIGQQPLAGDDEASRMLFRMAVPHRSTRVRLYWRASLLDQFILPILSRDEFLRSLEVDTPTLFARLGDRNVPCEAIVEEQCRGLTAAALLRSRTSLLPILDLRASLELLIHRTGQIHTMPLNLTSTQLAARQTMVSLNLPPRLRIDGGASLRWSVGGLTYGNNKLRTVSAEALGHSLFALDARYAYGAEDGTLGFSRYLMLQPGICRLGPCFLVATREAGLAALHRLRVRVEYKDGETLPEYLEQEVLVTDGPSLFIPMTTTPEHFQRIASIDLFNQGEHLAQLSLSTRDAASFTSEGGFIPAHDYPWSPVAEEELTDHLRKLMEVPHSVEPGA
jgi:hypothetical protein